MKKIVAVMLGICTLMILTSCTTEVGYEYHSSGSRYYDGYGPVNSPYYGGHYYRRPTYSIDVRY